MSIAKLRQALSVCTLGGLLALGQTTSGCAPTEGETVNLHGQRVRLTILHTSDIHSRLFPYEYTPLQPDKQAGLVDGKGPYGGVARMAYILKRERARADRSVHIDGGDVFQGAPIFNYFNGEAEVRALTAMGTDAMVIANHDFDRGALTAFTQFEKWSSFPVLAANYRIDDPSFPGNQPIGALLKPYTVINVRGLRVGVIGMGNLSTLTSIFEVPNKLGLMPYKTTEIAQFYIDILRPQVDLVVVVTHLGLEVDQRMIVGTEGIDVVLGGHNHIVVSPPQEIFDCGGVDLPDATVEVPAGEHGEPKARHCKPRRVLLMHSGAFAKFVGRLDVTVTDSAAEVESANGKSAGWYEPVNGFEIISHTQQIIPIDNDVPEERTVAEMLEPYKQALKNVGNLDLLVGYAPNDVLRRSPSGGDSQLGNLVATSMWLRLGVQTDFAMTNTTGIRADLPKGPVTLEQMFNVFPFDNSISKMQLSGGEIFQLFDFAARRSASRACSSVVQVAGAYIAMNCGTCDARLRPDFRDPDFKSCAEQIFIGYRAQTCTKESDCDPDPVKARFTCDFAVGRCRAPISQFDSYEIATNNYLAGGGSGFKVLQRNTTQLDTKIQQRDAVTDFVRGGKPCGWVTPACTDDTPCKPLGGTCIKGQCSQGDLLKCSADADCGSLADFVCACPESATVSSAADAVLLTCGSKAACAAGAGRCVMRSCRDDVADFHDNDTCLRLVGADLASCRQSACSQAGEQCKFLACLDEKLGAQVDGRLQMLGR
ncbi:MAG: bifunctional UDP-sugar hydrolase/5'-nucleotidase [Polyangiales bacterium]